MQRKPEKFGLIDGAAAEEVSSSLSVPLCLPPLSSAVSPEPQGSCWDGAERRNANVSGLRGGKITLIMCGWTHRMAAIERGESVWTERGLCYSGRAPASGSWLRGALCECLHSRDTAGGAGLQLSVKSERNNGVR